MAFNHFRIIIVIFAAFGAFFGYICRLNLSLTIDKMVVRDEATFQPSSPDIALDESYSMGVNLPNLNTEEHALAWISRSTVKRKIKSTGHSNRTKLPREDRTAALAHLLSVDDSSNDTNASKLNVTVLETPQGPDKIDPVEEINLMQWSEQQRNDLLGAFFLGYVFSQIPCARAAEAFGAKSLFLFTGLGSGICSILFPMAAKLTPDSITLVYIDRVMMGFTQGALFPAAYVLLCEWLPKSERSRWLPVPSALSRIGTILMNFTLPLVLLHFNWEMVFYISGGVTLAWCVLFAIFAANSPSQSKLISKAELLYIESHMEPRVGTLNHPTDITASGFEINQPSTPPSVNWLNLAINRPVLILTLVMFTSEWCNMLLLVKLPGFLGPVLKMDINEIGFWSSALVAVYCVQYPFSGFLASKLESTDGKGLSSLQVRKIFELLAHLMQGSACLLIALCDNKTIIIGALFLMMLGRSTVGGGQCLMPPELSKDYPGTVFAYANSLANIAGIVGPMAVNWLVTKPDMHSSWQWLFIWSAVLFYVVGITFCILAQNKPQNYSRKVKPKGPGRAISEAQLTMEKNPEQIFKMDAFAKVASEPPKPRS